MHEDFHWLKEANKDENEVIFEKWMSMEIISKELPGQSPKAWHSRIGISFRRVFEFVDLFLDANLRLPTVVPAMTSPSGGTCVRADN